MAYRVFIHPSAPEDIEGLPPELQKRILSTAKRKVGEDPHGPWAKRLKGAEDLWRLRVGDYRIIYEVREDGEVVVVITSGTAGKSVTNWPDLFGNPRVCRGAPAGWSEH